MKNRTRLFAAVLGLILGLFIALAFEFTLLILLSSLFDRQFTPRGLGWVIMPVIGGFSGCRIGYNIDAFSPKYFNVLRNFSETRLGRAAIVALPHWVVIWTLFSNSENGFGDYWSSQDWSNYWVGLFAVPLSVVLLTFGGRWVMRGRPSDV